jgi:thiamine transport system substrate-binding protein
MNDPRHSSRSTRFSPSPQAWRRQLVTAAMLTLVAACSNGKADSTADSITATGAAAAPIDTASDTSTSTSTSEITLLAYESFAAPEALNAFTAETGIKVTIAKVGDTGTLVNKAILTAGNPEGDVLWGVDSTLLSRALGNDVFDPYLSTAGPIDPMALGLVPDGQVTPVDSGDVCLNVDLGWFAGRNINPPKTLAELTEPAYSDLTVVENPATSSPGLAFLLATIAEFGPEGYVDYWKQLKANGVLAVDSWDAAYYTEFTAGGGAGSRPIVVSYASSPPFGVVDGKATTASVDASCYRIVEFAGVLRGTEHPAEARKLIDFMVSEAFQAELPDTNYVYPVRVGTPLSELFEKFAKPVETPLSLTPQDIDANRDAWIEQWTKTIIG